MVVEYVISECIFYFLRALNVNNIFSFYATVALFKSCEMIFALLVLNRFLDIPKYYNIKFGKKTLFGFLFIIILVILVSFFNYNNILYATFTGVTAAFPEEYIFRGIFLSNLLIYFKNTKYSEYKSIIVSASLFSVYHLGNLGNQSVIATIVQMIIVLGMGILFGSLYVKTGSLLIPITVHFFIDFIISALNGLDTNYISSPANSAEVFIYAFLQLIFYLCLAFVVLNNNNLKYAQLPARLYT